MNFNGSVPSNLDESLRLVLLLEQSGWRLVGGQEGYYSRLANDDLANGREASLLVPTNPNSPDFSDLMSAVIHRLETDYTDLWRRELLPRLTMVRSDAIRFRKETSAPSGMIPWDEGQSMIVAARATLLAGAKSFIEPARYFSNRNGRFASRYLESVLMGQTAIGSYIVTAFASSDTNVALRSSDIPPIQYDGIDSVRGRIVTDSVVQAIGATVDALDAYRHGADMSAFDERVPRGVSHEMVSAVSALAENANTSSITVEWHSEDPISTEPSRVETFEFSEDDVPILRTAAVHLVQVENIKNVRIIGRVHLLTKKQADGPGVVGVDDGKSKYRVRLDSDTSYHDAVRAHDEERPIEVQGELAREGTMNWLYNAVLLRVGFLAEEPDPSIPALFDT